MIRREMSELNSKS